MIDRRELLKIMALGLLCPSTLLAEVTKIPQYIKKTIPSSGEKIKVIGMGTSRTFNVGSSNELREARTKVLAKFFEMGGQLIDSSPMYGSSEAVLGYGLKKLGIKPQLVSATKVWTSSVEDGKRQFQQSLKLWGQDTIDIYQIHNLVNWKDHIKVLRKYKEEGKIKYVGITTSHGRRLEDFRNIMKTEKLDFVQFTYNLDERWNEHKTLDLAKDKGIAVMINRPFKRGELFDRVKGKPLPEWAKEIDCKTWSQYFLKWIVSHPAVTCTVPATSRVDHMKENMGALTGRQPDAKMRQKMLKHFHSL